MVFAQTYFIFLAGRFYGSGLKWVKKQSLELKSINFLNVHEQIAVTHNQILIERMQQRISRKLSEIWGEKE
jgi:hypothetical protein